MALIPLQAGEVRMARGPTLEGLGGGAERFETLADIQGFLRRGLAEEQSEQYLQDRPLMARARLTWQRALFVAFGMRNSMHLVLLRTIRHGGAWCSFPFYTPALSGTVRWEGWRPVFTGSLSGTLLGLRDLWLGGDALKPACALAHGVAYLGYPVPLWVVLEEVQPSAEDRHSPGRCIIRCRLPSMARVLEDFWVYGNLQGAHVSAPARRLYLSTVLHTLGDWQMHISFSAWCMCLEWDSLRLNQAAARGEPFDYSATLTAPVGSHRSDAVLSKFVFTVCWGTDLRPDGKEWLWEHSVEAHWNLLGKHGLPQYLWGLKDLVPERLWNGIRGLDAAREPGGLG